jgi:hypothetical protein
VGEMRLCDMSSSCTRVVIKATRGQCVSVSQLQTKHA